MDDVSLDYPLLPEQVKIPYQNNCKILLIAEDVIPREGLDNVMLINLQLFILPVYTDY